MPILVKAPPRVLHLLKAKGYAAVYISDGVAKWHVPDSTVLGYIRALYGIDITYVSPAAITKLATITGPFPAVTLTHN